jgi:hypothetical protein
MALAQHLFALAGLLTGAWAAALTLFLTWMLAYSRPSPLRVQRHVDWIRHRASSRMSMD